jgi:hypothetical protein
MCILTIKFNLCSNSSVLQKEKWISQVCREYQKKNGYHKSAVSCCSVALQLQSGLGSIVLKFPDHTHKTNTHKHPVGFL